MNKKTLLARPGGIPLFGPGSCSKTKGAYSRRIEE